MAIKPKRPNRAAADKRDKKATPKVATEESRQTRKLAANENESRQTRKLAANENESRQTRKLAANENESRALA